MKTTMFALALGWGLSAGLAAANDPQHDHQDHQPAEIAAPAGDQASAGHAGHDAATTPENASAKEPADHGKMECCEKKMAEKPANPKREHARKAGKGARGARMKKAAKPAGTEPKQADGEQKMAAADVETRLRENSAEIQKKLAEIGSLMKKQAGLVGELAEAKEIEARKTAQAGAAAAHDLADDLRREFSDRLDHRLGELRESRARLHEDIHRRLDESGLIDPEALEALRKDIDARVGKRLHDIQDWIHEEGEPKPADSPKCPEESVKQEARHIERQALAGLNDFAIRFAQTPQGREMTEKMMNWMRERGEQMTRRLDDLQRDNASGRQAIERLVARIEEIQTELKTTKSRLDGLETKSDRQ